jgi:AGZA family xanthine/uracil permease-like MFS transporter
LIVDHDRTLVTLGDVWSTNIIVSMLGLIMIGSLVYHNIKGGILIGIAALTFVFWNIDDSYPSQIFSFPTLENSISDYVDLSLPFSSSVELKKLLPAIAAFVFIGIFDVSGVMFGLGALGDLMEADGQIPGSLWAFLGSSAGTLIAACMGCTPIIITVECAAGIKEGGRTGLTAVTIGCLFLLSLFFAPLFGSVPQEATAPVLILVGAMMMGEAKNIEWEDMASAIPAFLTIVMMPLTYSITNGIVFGLCSAACFYVTTGAIFNDIGAYFTPELDEKSHRTGFGEEEQGLLSQNSPKSGSGMSRSHSGSFGPLQDNEVLARRPSFFNQKDNQKVEAWERTVRSNTPQGSPAADQEVERFGAVLN